jgi:hypothetical protein
LIRERAVAAVSDRRTACFGGNPAVGDRRYRTHSPVMTFARSRISHDERAMPGHEFAESGIVALGYVFVQQFRVCSSLHVRPDPTMRFLASTTSLPRGGFHYMECGGKERFR